MTPIGYKYNHAWGDRHDACLCVGYRWASDGPMVPELTESNVLRFGPNGQVQRLLRLHGTITSLWRSSAGLIVAATIDGRLLVARDGELPLRWTTFQAAGGLSCVWGLNEDLLFAAGRSGGKPCLLRWRGQDWSEVPCDGFPVSMHGIRPDCLYAVGYDGYIGRWTGSALERVGSPIQSPLSSVFVAGDDEIYACGPTGTLLDGTVYGWVERLASEHTLYAVAKHGGQVWIAAGDAGLFTLSGDALVPVRPDLRARSLKAGERLLITAPDVVIDTADGKAFTGYQLDGLVSVTDGVPPAWLA
jgi:hypothetical protein